METSGITLVTTTFYQTTEDPRFKLAVKTVVSALKAGHKVVIVDGSPNTTIAPEFAFLGTGVFAFRQTSGTTMGGSRRQAFTEAMKLGNPKTVFVWSEPEKIHLIPVLPEIVQPILNGKFHIVIPSRSAGTWDTYPLYQYKTEQLVNSAFQELFNLPGFDPTFGPMAFSWTAAEVLRDFDPARFGVADTYIQQFAIPLAIKLGLKVGQVTVPCPYPPEQREQEEEPLQWIAMLEKRFKQGEEIVSAFLTMKDRLGL